MSNLFRAAVLWGALAPAASFAATITGDVTGGGSFAGTVTQSGAWVSSNVSMEDQVSFWSLTATGGDQVSIVVTSDMIDFGISVYEGLVDDFDVFTGAFLNDGDFGGNTFIAGTNPVTGGTGAAALFNLLLPISGVYTIAVGAWSSPIWKAHSRTTWM